MLVGLIPILLFSYLLYFLASIKKHHPICPSHFMPRRLLWCSAPPGFFQAADAAYESSQELSSIVKHGPSLEIHPTGVYPVWPLALISYTLNSTLCPPLPAKAP